MAVGCGLRLAESTAREQKNVSKIQLLNQTGSYSNDFPAFHIESFFSRFTHRKCFARQSTIQNDGLEEIGLAHGRQDKPEVAGNLSQSGDCVPAMHVIDLFKPTCFLPIIQEGLQCANRQVGGRSRKM